jgi:heptaprenyl diphosphate synthase
MASVAEVSLSERLQLAPLDGDLARIEQLLMRELAGHGRFLDEVTSYLAGAGGKLLRPVLTMCGAYAGQRGHTIEPAPDAAIVAAVAVEMLHLGSLYHDDVIDEAKLRRGGPSTNAKWDNIIAVIGGDILLARAINLASRIGSTEVILLARTLEAVCAGQADELMFLYDLHRDEAAYERAIAGKTAALMAAALQFGALAAAFDRIDLEGMTVVGHELGMAFQLVDDLLDFAESSSAIGKSPGADIAKGVYTLPVIVELRTNARLRELLGSPPSAAAAEEARELVMAGKGVARTVERAREHMSRSLTALDGNELHPDVEQALRILGDVLFEPVSSPRHVAEDGARPASGGEARC